MIHSTTQTFYRLIYSDDHRWLRWIIIFGVIGISAISFMLPEAARLLLLVVPFAVGGALFVLQQPHWGLIALIPAALVVPFEIGTGTGSTINPPMLIICGLIGLWWFSNIVFQEIRWFVPSRTYLPLVVLLVLAIVSLLVGQFNWFPASPAPMRAQLGGLALFFLSAGAYILMANRLDNLRWLEWMVWGFLAIGAVHVAGHLLPGLDPLAKVVHRDAIGSLFWTWLVALAFAQLWLNRTLSVRWRVGLALLLLGALYVSVVRYYDWRSGWLPPLAAMAFIIGLRSWRLGVLMGVLGLIPVAEILTEVVALDAYSYSTRLEAWEILLTMWQRNPLTGFGPANYYWYTPLFPIRGYYVQFNSHSQYVDLLAQVGVLGLGAYLWFFIAVWRVGMRLRRRVPEGFTQAYVYGALGGLVGMLVAGALGDWVIPFVYNIGLSGFRASVLGWLFLGALVALERMENGRVER